METPGANINGPVGVGHMHNPYFVLFHTLHDDLAIVFVCDVSKGRKGARAEEGAGK